MADSGQQLSNPAQDGPSNGHDAPADGSHSQQLANGTVANTRSSRKRTKTGCLTCRKRRIKCGEERPICNNCVKSKRSCEGYNQRVIFKDPMNAFRTAGGLAPQGQVNGTQVHRLVAPMETSQQYNHSQSISSANQASLPTIAPKPIYQRGHPPIEAVADQAPIRLEQSASSAGERGGIQAPPKYRPGDLPPRMRDIYQKNTSPPHTSLLNGGSKDTSHCVPGQNIPPVPQPSSQVPKHAAEEEEHRQEQIQQTWVYSTLQSHGLPTPLADTPSAFFFPPSSRRAVPQSSDGTAPPPFMVAQPNHGFDDAQRTGMQQPPVINDDWLLVHPEHCTEVQNHNSSRQLPSNESLRAHGWPEVNNPIEPLANSPIKLYDLQNVDQTPQLLRQPFTETITPLEEYPAGEESDEYYDVDSDDMEIDQNDPPALAERPREDLELILAVHARTDDGRQRAVTTLVDHTNVLAHYRPAMTASPLLDVKTARIFCHFVTVTAPSISMFERHPTNPSIMFTGAPVPRSHQSLWTYTLPTLALGNQGLLHAMLALASLHLAKIVGGSLGPSMKHYHFSLRRISKALGMPSRRNELTTLAASLLLGYYEVMCAEHNKWSSHLRGATHLIKEIDFAGPTRQLKDQRAQQEALRMRRMSHAAHGFMPDHIFPGGQAHPRSEPNDDLATDERLVSTLMGRRVRYDDHGQVIDHGGHHAPGKTTFTAKDMDVYEARRDLYWWYCKNDLYSSMISGNRLLLDYERWGDCPPRARIGRLDAVFGTWDHLLLLVARVADFAAKDQPRKVKAVAASGGVWKPAPWMNLGPPPGISPQHPGGSSPNVPISTASTQSMNPAVASQSSTSTQQQLPSYGAIPPTTPISQSSGFSNASPGFSPPKPSDPELEAATVEAQEEWREIKAAFRVYEECLGSDFKPLSPEYMQPLATPFGPALYYRTYSVACIWVLYYTGLILIERVHPAMPPAMFQAAGIAARQTARYANAIGRACAGLGPTSANTPLNPSLASALMESTMGLFFAGVQIQDPAQRGWTVSRLLDITRRTGWGSSETVAAGCETAWQKMAERGKGPPYQRTMNPSTRDDRVSGKTPHTTGEPPKDNSDRRFVTVDPNARVHWAMGLLALEEDFSEKLSMG